jgi:AcrR family transcriptional regulator
MPRLWTDTIESHRAEVREAILEAAAALATKNGATNVTMTEVAKQTGVGRATLYKYFDDVQAILVAWHEQQIAGHVAKLEAARDRTGDALDRIESVLETYALLTFEHHGKELVALLARGEHAVRANERFLGMLQALLEEGAKRRLLRDDVPPPELASYCVHALSGAVALRSRAAVRRLVAVTMAGLRGQR